jgi:hypothetical protein
MSQRGRPSAEALDPIRERLRQLIVIAGPAGIDYRGMAATIKEEFADDVGKLLGDQLLVDWVRKEVRSMRTAEGLPLAAPFEGRAVQIDFWDLDMFKSAIERYTSASRKNLRLAEGLAVECERIHGVRLQVPFLAGDTEAAAI